MGTGRKYNPETLVWRAIVYLGFALMTMSCTTMFFFPQKELVRTPESLGLHYRNVNVETRDGLTLHGWLLIPSTTPVGSVYFLHGNAENISTHIASVVWMVDAGYQVFLVDYRGYGLSQGSPDVPEVHEDIRAGAQWLLEQRPTRPLVVFGQSLGASLSISALQRFPAITNEFDGLISEAAFSGYGRIAREVAASNWFTWLLQFPADWMLKGPYDPIKAIIDLQLPIMLIHSIDDEVISINHARDLHSAANSEAQLLEVTGPHIQAMASQSVQREVLSFINSLVE